jgi:hypothetical protein
MSGSIVGNNQNTVQVSSGASVQPVSLGYYPAEGSKVCSLRYNFSALLNYFEDLQQLKIMGMETAIQSMFIDNSQNSQAVTIVIPGTQQVIVVPPNYQGIFPIFLTDGPAYFISVAAVGGYTNVLLLNVPCNTAGVWNAQAPATSGASQALLTGTKAFQVSANAAGNNTIIPGVGGQRFFLKNLYVQLDANATLAVAGEEVITILDSATTLLVCSVALITAAPAGLQGPIAVFDLPDLNYISLATGNSLTVQLSTALATGNIRVTAFGGYTTNTQ